MTDLSETDARAALDALPGLAWRPFGRENIPAVLALFGASEAFDHNSERWSLGDLEEFWDSPRSRPDEDVLLGADGDDLVAVAWAGCDRRTTERRRIYLGGTVHPSRRGQGIGRAVLAWELAHAFAWDDATREDGFGPLVARLTVPTEQTDVRHLGERFGLAVERYFFEMSRRLDGPVTVEVPEGVDVVDWDPARSREVHQLLDLAFRDGWGHTDRPEEIWDEFVESHAFRPAWSALALDSATGAVVGAVTNCSYEQDWEPQGYTEGYTGELGVAATHRGRGVATALLLESMRRFADAGLEAAGLGVDAANPTGALRLYESLGYVATAETVIHELRR